MSLTLVVAFIAICYVFLLFLLAYGAERRVGQFPLRVREIIYGLSLAVYCSSWSFLGTVGQAANDIWSYVPIFLGPILIFTFGFGLLRKMVMVSKAQHITSVADFIAARYGKSQRLAALVTLIAVVGIMPYIVLQLKAIVASLQLFQTDGQVNNVWVPLLISALLAIFAILFGTRKLDATEHNPGMMLAIAFESLVKLTAFLLLGLVVSFYMFNDVSDIWQQASQAGLIHGATIRLENILPELIVGMAAFLCMPRQFHVMVVECESDTMLRRSRWIFPLYLLIFGSLVVPLALAGNLLLGQSVTPDTYVINLPLMQDMPWLAVIALLGALSAATGMVIVAVVTISTMISNEWLLPVMLRTGGIKQKNFGQFSQLLLNSRRLSIVIILAFGYINYLWLGQSDSLSYLGMLSFGAFAQLAPAMVGGLYWKKGNRYGVFLGLALGFGLWGSLLMDGGDVATRLAWPETFSPDINDALLALILNSCGYVLGSLWFRAGVAERIQASSFVSPGHFKRGQDKRHVVISQQDLLILASRFVSPTKAYESFSRFSADAVNSDSWHKSAPAGLIAHTEHMLARVLGASSAALVMDTVLEGRELGLDEVMNLVDDASTKIILSQDMLRGAIEHAYEGMSVVDKDLNLVAWNKKYVELYQYPDGFLKAGMAISDVIRFNAARGFCGPGDVEQQVEKRLQHMSAGSAHVSERQRRDGRVIKIQGNPMPNGGFVMTFTDITQYRQQEQALREMNETLEVRVAARTRELASLNTELIAAKAQEEMANASKSRFLAAVGHDLMQPLNAARLFTASLAQYPPLDAEARKTVSHVNQSLKIAGELLTDLLDISKLDSGTVEVNVKDVAIADLLDNLGVEFSAMAAEHHIDFTLVKSSLVVKTDVALLRRILQNFLTNAYRYARGDKVLLGCRRRGEFVEIQVIDTGCGIEREHIQDIFREFKRLNQSGSEQVSGLGLGLAIAKRLSLILNIELRVDSVYGQGSLFSVLVPLGSQQQLLQPVVSRQQIPTLVGLKVLCIDNEEAILAGLNSLLSRWQCEVVCAPNVAQAKISLGLKGIAPEIVLADYQLDNGETGLDAMDHIRAVYGCDIPGVLITANTSQQLIDDVQERGYHYLAKMIKPAALRALLSSLVKK
ncbi:PAS domain-containing hybrid sensor histidine kinase/response regulator [Shewanella sp. NIFS-20-20]|uniref:hybrid sensor histidine kinase/response regulator n=1 Tax=Shewanella sp. NIFS-20-20 TaxID=2853806 RepID=UPI001C443E7C|nr:PAS domain-containing hybrid sensor histidine kinase/response regulator [Shewanella sp. NIFS-20-20]MBV7314559.1 hybrid sensor histidine kinase/response regulator [Shewanella sp. NIFS-20-20]